MYLYFMNVRGKYEWKNQRKCVVAKLLFLISVYEFPLLL